MSDDPKMPDVPMAQWIAVAQAAIAVAVSAGAPISDELAGNIIMLAVALAVALPLSDAQIRKARNKRLGQNTAREDGE